MERPRPLPDRPEVDASAPGTTPAGGAAIASSHPCMVDGPSGPMPVHGDRALLADHMARHFVERSARPAFAAAHPFLRAIDVFADDRAAEQFLRQLAHAPANDPSFVRSFAPAFDAVCAAYARVVQHALREAAVLGWSVAPSRSTRVHLDSAGVLVVVGGGVVRTVFIPGVDRVDDDIAHRHESRTERIARAAREARWTGDERYFYRVFRPALRAVRRFPTSGLPGDVQYGALKRVLPAVSDLGLAAWRSLRAEHGHPPIDRVR